MGSQFSSKDFVFPDRRARKITAITRNGEFADSQPRHPAPDHATNLHVGRQPRCRPPRWFGRCCTRSSPLLCSSISSPELTTSYSRESSAGLDHVAHWSDSRKPTPDHAAIFHPRRRTRTLSARPRLSPPQKFPRMMRRYKLMSVEARR